MNKGISDPSAPASEMLAPTGTLSYNSTTEKAISLDGYRLREWTPEDIPHEYRRYLYLAEDVHEELHSATGIGLLDVPVGQMRATMNAFVRGYNISVTSDWSEDKLAALEKLDDLPEVWAICARKPKSSQIRVLGRFLTKDCFVGLKIYTRRFLGEREHYSSIASTIPQDWKAILPNISPLQGTKPSDFLVKNYRDLDA